VRKGPQKFPSEQPTFEVIARFRRLVSGEPTGGRELGDPIDREVCQARQSRAKVVADGDLQPTTGFDDREDRGDAWSGILAAEVDPVFAT
jgi:hypothetical protein